MSYVELTEMPGTRVSKEQVQRLANRYHFAAGYCENKDALQLACGPGIGLGVLERSARSLMAGDIDPCIVDKASETYECSIDCRCIDAQELPFEDNSFDVIIMFEAIYYLEKPERFVQEARRVLRDEGTIIVCNPNKDLPDFHPSAHSYRYFNPQDFAKLFEPLGLDVTCYGDSTVNTNSWRSGIVSVLKKWAVKLDLIPKTMKGREPLKRLFFGKLVNMPDDLSHESLAPDELKPITNNAPDPRYRVIFNVARLP